MPAVPAPLPAAPLVVPPADDPPLPGVGVSSLLAHDDIAIAATPISAMRSFIVTTLLIY
jgi:hypothetical protein